MEQIQPMPLMGSVAQITTLIFILIAHNTSTRFRETFETQYT